MRLLVPSILGFAVGTALAASCPYANKATEPKGCPYAAKAARDADAGTRPAPLRKRVPPPSSDLGVMYMNRIAPSGSQLWIADADGSNAVELHTHNTTKAMDYHSSWSPDGQWIVFTSERRGDGQADVYRIRPDGTDLETLVMTDSFEDIGTISPDGTKLAYVSTYINYTANIFVKDLKTGKSVNLTGSDETVGNVISPHSFFRPTWSHDGEWLAFSSDRNTDWTGHTNGTGWEHTMNNMLYVMRANGSDFRLVIGEDGYMLGSPSWSFDDTRLAYYNITREDTYYAHGTADEEEEVTSQIFSVDVATGLDVVQHTFDDTLKVTGRYINKEDNIGYLIKAGMTAGLHYTSPDSTHKYFNSSLRNPAWSPDGTKVVYEIYSWDQRPAEKPLWSWDTQREYLFMDVFPQFNLVTERLATTQKQLGPALGDVVTTGANYSDLDTVLNVLEINDTATALATYEIGLAGAFQPTWHPDGEQIAVGYGEWFFDRAIAPASLYVVDLNGTYRNITDNRLNAGFPSYSPDGKKLVYRLWDWENGPLGLRILDLTTGETTNLTWGWDNTPGWSADGETIVYTCQTNWTVADGGRWLADRFDICTIKPDGTDWQRLTYSEANDAHAVWSNDGRILYNSGMYGFRDESPLYDNTFQPYGQIIIMNADGTNKTMLTDSMWEDSMPLYIAKEYFE